MRAGETGEKACFRFSSFVFQTSSRPNRVEEESMRRLLVDKRQRRLEIR